MAYYLWLETNVCNALRWKTNTIGGQIGQAEKS